MKKILTALGETFVETFSDVGSTPTASTRIDRLGHKTWSFLIKEGFYGKTRQEGPG